MISLKILVVGNAALNVTTRNFILTLTDIVTPQENIGATDVHPVIIDTVQPN